MRKLLFTLLSILIVGCKSQELEKRSVKSYFEEIAKLEQSELIKQGVLLDSLTIADQYLDQDTKGLNEDGYHKYAEIKMSIYQSFFKDYLYQQHIEYKNHVYVLYFTMAGFDDMEWDIIKWKKEDWKNEDTLSRERLSTDSTLTKVFWNYDEGPKNLENIRIFIANDFLVLERGNLYHSVYDLKTDSLILNEESPWHASNAANKEEMNTWIRTNLHEKIKENLTKGSR